MRLVFALIAMLAIGIGAATNYDIVRQAANDGPTNFVGIIGELPADDSGVAWADGIPINQNKPVLPVGSAGGYNRTAQHGAVMNGTVDAGIAAGAEFVTLSEFWGLKNVTSSHRC